RRCTEALRTGTLRTGETVGAAVAADPALQASVDRLLKRLRPAGAPRYFADGGVRIEVEVPLDGGLPEALLPAGVGAPSRQEE
ncbi:MAG TPA: hypothetical protein VEP68_06200, partial [Anaeromyxobacteraceae bacterium]|nr:hypothetical protein [Anaeromyxobacteraceae bacterium]